MVSLMQITPTAGCKTCHDLCSNTGIVIWVPTLGHDFLSLCRPMYMELVICPGSPPRPRPPSPPASIPETSRHLAQPEYTNISYHRDRSPAPNSHRLWE